MTATPQEWAEFKANIKETQQIGWRELLWDMEIEAQQTAAATTSAVKVILEAINVTKWDTHLTSPDDYTIMAASFFPPVAGAPQNQTFMALLRKTLKVFGPRKRERDGNTDGEGRTGKTGVLMTYDEREKAERFIKVGSVKMPRHSEAPWDTLYPLWLKMLETSTTITTKEAWNRSLQQFFHGCVIPELHKPRFFHVQQSIEIWFTLASTAGTNGTAATQDTIPNTLVRLWFHLIETLLEILLLSEGIRLSSSTAQATTKFHQLCYKRWSSAETLNYFSDLQDAKTFVAPKTDPQQPKNPFRRI